MSSTKVHIHSGSAIATVCATIELRPNTIDNETFVRNVVIQVVPNPLTASEIERESRTGAEMQAFQNGLYEGNSNANVATLRETEFCFYGDILLCSNLIVIP